MLWPELQRRIYFEDGSWRDIYVLQTTTRDWEKWADLVNKKYRVEFWDAKTGLKTDNIDFGIVKEYWDSNGDREVVTATIKIDAINVRCHFFDDSEIENDIDPREIKSQEDHNKLITYLSDISIALEKEVIVTDENANDSVLLRIKGGECILDNA